MDTELREALREIREDIKELLPLKQAVERHEVLLYGNGQPGLVESVEQAKARHKLYDKLFAAGGAAAAALFGADAFWRHFKW